MRDYSECPSTENGTAFSELPFHQESLHWDDPEIRVPFTFPPEFPEFPSKDVTWLLIAFKKVQSLHGEVRFLVFSHHHECP